MDRLIAALGGIHLVLLLLSLPSATFGGILGAYLVSLVARDRETAFQKAAGAGVGAMFIGGAFLWTAARFA